MSFQAFKMCYNKDFWILTMVFQPDKVMILPLYVSKDINILKTNITTWQLSLKKKENTTHFFYWKTSTNFQSALIRILQYITFHNMIYWLKSIGTFCISELVRYILHGPCHRAVFLHLLIRCSNLYRFSQNWHYYAVGKCFFHDNYFVKLECLSWSPYFWKGYALSIMVTNLNLDRAQTNQTAKSGRKKVEKYLWQHLSCYSCFTEKKKKS